MERGHQIETTNTAYFRHDYDSEHADMRRLYEQAKIDQWNAATDIDWSRPLDGDGGLIADDLVDIHGTKFWDRLSPAERVEVNRRVTQWRLSTLVHGEHGAILVCSQIVENVQGQDAPTVLEAFCLEYYTSAPSVPPEILVPRSAGDATCAGSQKTSSSTFRSSACS